MAIVLKWLGGAVKGLRTFAYGPGTRPRVGVALGGGFARGISHIGLLRTFEQHGIPIDCLAGTSIGALIGAAYAAGTSLDDMERQGCVTRFRDFGRWTLSRMGMASNERLEAFLHRFTPVTRFEDLQLPFAIATTDILKGESVFFTQGEIGPPLRASCAYPGLFIPIEYQGRVLVDGFLTSEVPTEAVRRMGAELIIAVHLEPGLLQQKPRNTIEVIGRSFSIIQGAVHMPWQDIADIIIEPEVHSFLWDDFAKTPELVVAGAAAAHAAMPQLRDALEGRTVLKARARGSNGDGNFPEI